VIEALGKLPAPHCTSVLRQLGELQGNGLTSLLPGRLQFWCNHDFAIYAPRRQFSVGTEDGAVLRGYWCEPFDQSYYLYDLQEITGGQYKDTDKTFYLFDRVERPAGLAREDFELADNNWLEGEMKKPFINKANGEMNRVSSTNATMASYIEEVCFYGGLDAIDDTAALAREQDTRTAWDYQHSKERVAWLSAEGMDVDALIDDIAAQKQTLLFVHFVDPADALSAAQADFINLMAFYLHNNYPALQLKILPVALPGHAALRDHYFENNMLARSGRRLGGKAWPFVMVFGTALRDALEHQTSYVRKQGARLLDFDLFEGCRAMLENRQHCNFAADDRFKRNLRRALHETSRYAGLVGNNARTLLKDYTGMDEQDVYSAMFWLERNSVVLKLHRDEDDLTTMATGLCNHLKSSGCPYVSLVLCDGDPDVIELHDSSDTFIKFPDVDASDDMFWSLEQEIRVLYQGHYLNGGSPLLIRAAKPKTAIEKQITPDIFKTLKKPLH